MRRTALTIFMFLLRFENYILYYFIVVPLPPLRLTSMKNSYVGEADEIL